MIPNTQAKLNRALKKTAFARWIKSHRPSRVVGIAGEFCRCPVAQFLKETTGCTFAIFGCVAELRHDGQNWLEPTVELNAPDWVEEFANFVDTALESGDLLDADGRVRADEAYALLTS